MSNKKKQFRIDNSPN